MASAKATSPKTRKDPTTRFFGAMPFFDNLEGRDPLKAYKWVSKSTPNNLPTSVDWYGMMGFEIELIQPGGVRPRGVKSLKEGDAIEVGGMVLMSIEADTYEEIIAAGQAHADERERKIIKKKGLMDPARGGGNRYVKLTSSISEIRQELGGASDG